MSILEIIIVAFALSVDTFAVAIAISGSVTRVSAREVFKTGFFFGGFQGIMAVLGWIGGTGFKQIISGFDHWVAFGLLAFIGAKMIYESFHCRKDAIKNPFNNKTLFVLAIATSIDSFAIGITFSLLSTQILLPALFIGFVTFAVSCSGAVLGSRFGHLLGNKAEILGGVVLIGLGIKIVFEHI